MNTHRADDMTEPFEPPRRRGSILTPRRRRWLYGIAAAVAPVAIIYGYVTEQQAVLWLNLAGALLFTVAAGNTDDERGNRARHRSGGPAER